MDGRWMRRRTGLAALHIGFRSSLLVFSFSLGLKIFTICCSVISCFCGSGGDGGPGGEGCKLLVCVLGLFLVIFSSIFY